MGPYYERTCAELGMQADMTLLNDLKEKNKKRLQAFMDEIADAEANLGKKLVLAIPLH